MSNPGVEVRLDLLLYFFSVACHEHCPDFLKEEMPKLSQGLNRPVNGLRIVCQHQPLALPVTGMKWSKV